MLTAAVSSAVVVGAGLYALMTPPAEPRPDVVRTAVDAPPPMASGRPVGPAASAVSPGAAAIDRSASTPSVETAADSLRKVQVALAGGTAQEALTGAMELEGCAHADRTAAALMQGREVMALLPDAVKKMFGKIPAPSAEMIARAQADQRRCQVFDAATLARRGELHQRAYEGGANGAALPYLTWLRSEDGPRDATDPALIGNLQAAVRADGKAADLAVLASFAYGGSYAAEQAAASPVEAQAYRDAYFRIADEGAPGGAGSTRAQVDKVLVFGSRPPALTQQQQSEADAMAGQIVDAWHQRAHPGG